MNSSNGKPTGFFDGLIVYAGYFYMCLMGKTTRTVVNAHPGYDELIRDGKPVIYSLWHGRQIFLTWFHRRQGVCVMISKSKDGEFISRIAKKLGYQPVRGSTSKGGLEALTAIIEKAKSGCTLAFTPDGPRGPIGVVQPGVIITAKQSGMPVIPVAFAAKRKFIVGNWDKFHIPLPFNRVVVCYGEPFYVGANDAVEQKSAELKKAMDEVTARADSLI